MVGADNEKQGPVELKMTARKVKTSGGVWNWFIYVFVNEMQVCVSAGVWCLV